MKLQTKGCVGTEPLAVPFHRLCALLSQLLCGRVASISPPPLQMLHFPCSFLQSDRPSEPGPFEHLFRDAPVGLSDSFIYIPAHHFLSEAIFFIIYLLIYS